MALRAIVWGILGLAAVGAARADTCTGPVVQVATGAVCGKTVDGGPPGLAAKPVRAFLGIPFAAPPVGERRWAAPVPAAQWEGTRDATAFGPSCPQNVPSGVGIVSSEDCLTLNVWTPAESAADANASEKLPVMVFLYGGSFLHGGSAAPVYGGANLAAAGPVVVVTLNYRIGALGFLAGLDGVAGNFGLLDQQLGLQWVRDNIAAFGGDAKNVTLFGQSAGAMSVGIHLAAPESRDLFHAALMESNPYGIPYKSQEQAKAYATSLAEQLDCAPSPGPASCLRTKTVAEILTAQKNLPTLESLLLGLASFVPWGPVVGGPLLPAQPNRLEIDKPTILGTNKNEGTLFVAMQEQAVGTIGKLKYVAETDIAFGKHGEAVRKFYHSMGAEDPVAALGEIITDDLFVCANRFVLSRATVPIWGYQFAHAPSFPIWPEYPICAPTTGQVCHAAELPFVFGNPFGPDLWAKEARFTPPERALAATMMRLWTGFARTHTPPETAPPWDRFSQQTTVRLVLATTLETRLDLEARCRFWDALGYDLSGPLSGLF